jgi:hypothetical protein
MNSIKIICVMSMMLALALPLPLSAALGGDVSTVQADQAKMQGTLRTTSADSYAVHDIQASTGVDVKEYASASGKVFAITWNGPAHPDLRQLLGAYFEQYQQAVHDQIAQRRGHGPVVIQEPGLVVEMAGHMRSFSGRAYVPQMLPTGVRAEDLP